MDFGIIKSGVFEGKIMSVERVEGEICVGKVGTSPIKVNKDNVIIDGNYKYIVNKKIIRGRPKR